MTNADVQAKLEALQQPLERRDLRRLGYFNLAYIVMTKNLVAALGKQSFDDQKLVEELLAHFAQLYFEVVRSAINKQSLPKIWRRACWRLPWPGYANILLGAYAHITFDLPQSLRATVKHPDKFVADFDKINSVVLDSTRDVLKLLARDHVLARLIYKHPFLYRRPLLGTLTMWRDKAWREFIR